MALQRPRSGPARPVNGAAVAAPGGALRRSWRRWLLFRELRRRAPGLARELEARDRWRRAIDGEDRPGLAETPGELVRLLAFALFCCALVVGASLLAAWLAGGTW